MTPNGEGTGLGEIGTKPGPTPPAALLLGPDHRAAIDLVGRHDRDLGIGAARGGQDIGIRCELMRSEPRVEHDEILPPQGIESVPLDRVQHRRKGLLLVQVVAGVDLVDAPIVRDGRGAAGVRHLLHVYGEELVIIEGRHLARGAVGARGLDRRRGIRRGGAGAQRTLPWSGGGTHAPMVRARAAEDTDQDEQDGSENEGGDRFPSEFHGVTPWLRWTMMDTHDETDRYDTDAAPRRLGTARR